MAKRSDAAKGNQQQQHVCRNLSQLLPEICRHLPRYDVNRCRNMLRFVAVRDMGTVIQINSATILLNSPTAL